MSDFETDPTGTPPAAGGQAPEWDHALELAHEYAGEHGYEIDPGDVDSVYDEHELAAAREPVGSMIREMVAEAAQPYIDFANEQRLEHARREGDELISETFDQAASEAGVELDEGARNQVLDNVSQIHRDCIDDPQWRQMAVEMIEQRPALKQAVIDEIARREDLQELADVRLAAVHTAAFAKTLLDEAVASRIARAQPTDERGIVSRYFPEPAGGARPTSRGLDERGIWLRYFGG